MRASAMIIQTNEIEKSRFYSTNNLASALNAANPTTTTTAATAQPPVASASATNNHNHHHNNNVKTKSHAHDDPSSHTFQVGHYRAHLKHIYSLNVFFVISAKKNKQKMSRILFFSNEFLNI